MENTNESVDSQNDNGLGELETLDPSALRELVIKERTEKLDLDTKNKQLFERAKKAEGFDKDEDGNWIKIIERPSKAEKKPEKKEKVEELDYGMKAYLRSEQIDPSEFDWVKSQMDESGLQLEKLLKNSYFQSQLKEMRDQKSAENALPGKTRVTGDSSKSKVEFWIDKGELPPDTAENRQLRRDVVNRKVEIEKERGKFSNNPVVYG